MEVCSKDAGDNLWAIDRGGECDHCLGREQAVNEVRQQQHFRAAGGGPRLSSAKPHVRTLPYRASLCALQALGIA